MRHWFAQPLVLWLLAGLPALALLALWNHWRKRRALARLGDAASLAALTEPRRGRRFLRGLFLVLGLASLAAGAAGPQWGRDWKESAASGRDLVVVLDCSRSMSAETPSRLSLAKTALLDLAQTFRKRGGHRVALVVFAARAQLLCPLTHDYDHFREAVEGVDPDDLEPEIGPSAASVSGTRIGEGLHAALLAHDERSRGARDILLLSDGDDPAPDGEYRTGAAEARAEGVPVYAVGLGDPDAVNVIPSAGEPLRFGGEEVHTRLEEEPLQKIAAVTRGVYIPAHTSTLHLGQVYLDATAGQALRDEGDDDDRLPVYRQYYAWFLATALSLLTSAVLLPDRRPRARRAAEKPAPLAVAHGKTS